MEAQDTRDTIKKDKYEMPYWFKNSKFYKKLRRYEMSDEACLDYIGSMPELMPEEIWPVEDPLTPKEVDQALRMNKLRRLYLENEKWEIVQLGNIMEPVDESAYWDFVIFLTECYELLGEEYVNYILAPLGFVQHRYVTNKRIR
jgi:hypothetical protein